MFIMFPERILFNHRGHRGELNVTDAFATRMGQRKNKNSASRLVRFLLFFCQSHLAGIIRANPRYPWLLPLQPRSARSGLKTENRTLNTFSAFSLIELLVVIAIVGLLMTAAVPALNSVLENGRLTQAAAMLVNQFTLARQRASAENKNITVRFIRKDTSSPYDRIQLVTLDSANNATPVSRLTTLPMQTAIASDTALTSLMSLTESPANSTKDPSIPELGTSYLYRQCTFRPRGSLDLNIQGNWFATVVLLRNASNTTAPANFATIQVDPVNGGLQIYRP
jgi:uncharacterized protein (TIGR02596 family)